MDSVPVISDDYSFAQTTTNLLQMDLLVEGIKNSSASMVQSYAIQQLDDTHFQLISCENEETFSLHLTSESLEKVDLSNSENMPVIRSVEQDSVIHHSSSSILKPADSNQQLSHSSTKQTASEDYLSSYSCCNEMFDSLSAFRQHLKLHIAEEKFCCSICQARFLIENNLKIHLITSHPANSNVCPICKVSFQRKASLRSHVLMHQEEELFPCKQCEEEFQNYDELLKHMEDHALIKKPIDSLLCRYCKMKFETVADYNEHVAKHKEVKKNILKDKKVKKRANKNDRKRFKCKFCSKAFPKFYLLDRHERIHTGEKPFKCDICSKGFAQTNSLKFHLDKHKGLRPYCCTLCPAKFTQKGNLRAHVEKTHTAPKAGHRTYKCSQCACIFKKIASLNGHITKVHLNNEPEESSDPQSIINKVVNGLRELNNDAQRSGSKEDKLGMSEVKLAESQVTGGVRRYAIRQKKIGEVRWYFCNYCSSKFKKPSDLIRHFRTHTLERPFKCVKCEQNFSLKATLNSHLKTHNRPEAECNHCDTTFKNSRNFKAHVRNHEAAKAPNYVCRFCEKVFATFEEGKEHISAHEGEIQSTDNIIEPLLKQPLYQTTYGTLELKPPKSKVSNANTESALESPHHCKTCGAGFTRLMSLKRHMMHHNGERKFKCTICPKAFVTNYELKEHLKYHNNIKNYGCPTCGKKFSTSSLLKRHTIIHSNAESYMCPYCSKHFKTSALCRAHIKNIHQAMTGEELSVIKQPEKLASEASSSSNESAERSSGVLVSIAPENQLSNTPAELQSNYQMVYLDIGDMPTNNSDEILSQDSLVSSINLFNPLDSLQESATVFFSIDSGKPDMVDPNEVLKFTKLDKTDELVGAQPVQLDGHSEAPLVANLASDQGLYTVNLSELPISIINASESTSLLNNDIISGDPPVICINCHKMFASCSVFENHLCSAETARAVQGNLELIIQGANPDIVENKILNDKGPTGNTGDIVIHSSETIDEIPENINIYETQLLNNPSAANATLDLSDMKRYTNKGSLQPNLDQTKQLSCKHCTFTTQSEDQYRKHLFLHPDLSDKICKFCCKDFTKPSDLKRHLRTHTGEKPFECDQCHKKFSLKSTLESHFRTHNMPGVSKITCDVCNANFTSKSSLKVHMLLHTGAKPYGCRFCEQTFRTPATRKTHEKNQHSTNRVEAPKPPKLAGVKLIKFIAEQMAASVEQDLKKDEHSEVKEREQEPVETVDSQQLNWVPMDSTDLFHQLQPYGIIISSEADANVSRTMEDLGVLDVHNDLQLSNIKEENTQQPTIEVQNPKPQKNQGLKQKVQCDICHKWYSTKNVLRKHKKMLHVQDKKFPCIKCDKGYDQLEELNKHIAKLHSGHRPNTCQYCSNSFGEEGSLKTHIKRIHQKSLMGEETTNAILGLQYDLSSDLFV